MNQTQTCQSLIFYTWTFYSYIYRVCRCCFYLSRHGRTESWRVVDVQQFFAEPNSDMLVCHLLYMKIWWFLLFRSTPLSQPNKVGLKCLSVHLDVRPSVHKKFFEFNEIWHVVRGRWVMQGGMQYDPIQGQGHEPFKVGNPAIFKRYLFCPLQRELATDHWFLNYATISKFDQAGFLIFVLVFVSHDFELGRNVICEESNVSPIQG